jgi:chromosome segregation ATPase
MKRNFWLKGTALFAAVLGVVLMVGAQQDQSTKAKQAYVDTPRNKVKDIDQALQELEKARAELEKTLKNRDWEKELHESMSKLDAEKMKLQIEEAVKQVDAAKIQAEMEKAMKSIDMEKMKSDMQKALSDVDAPKIKLEIAEAMKAVDAEKLKAQIESSLAAVDMEKVKAELKKVQEIDLKKIQDDLRNIQPEIEKSMSEARESIEKAKVELTAYKGFINDLEKDGLIKKENYTIEYKKGDLFINGKKQPESVKKKYSDFLKDRKDFTIRKDADDFNIDHD